MTGCFVKKDHGEWTFNKDERRNFPSVIEARKYCHSHGLKDMHVIVEDGSNIDPAVIFVRLPTAAASIVSPLPLDALAHRNEELKRSAGILRWS